MLENLTKTYFARQYNLIREEHKSENALIEDRLRTWPEARLKREGVVLLGLAVQHRGRLYQERVLRFSCGPAIHRDQRDSRRNIGDDDREGKHQQRGRRRGRGAELPYHRFGVAHIQYYECRAVF